MARHFGLVALPLAVIFLLDGWAAAGNWRKQSDHKDCAVKELDFASMAGEWKYELSKSPLPDELTHDLNGPMFVEFKPNGASMQVYPKGMEDKLQANYSQPKPDEKPGYLVNRMMDPDSGEVVEIPLHVLAYAPDRYFVICTHVGKNDDWGLFVRPNVAKLTKAELKQVATGMQCAGLDLPA